MLKIVIEAFKHFVANIIDSFLSHQKLTLNESQYWSYMTGGVYLLYSISVIKDIIMYNKCISISNTNLQLKFILHINISGYSVIKDSVLKSVISLL